ncbi:general odorant-binding protein 56a-like [Eupeodes corollae]|uniref:general odorant-binding protein 56a-like n=1 Tax=Eupeodes corollae TaxID=290404 RepID=UPI00248FA9AB|nr:general odorant-binding protein 56a-like [Eupeodes corollae]
MKFLLAIVFVAVIAAAAGFEIPEDEMTRAMGIVGNCRDEITITDEEFEKLKDGENFAASENAKCLTSCIQEEAGITKDGVFQADAVLAKFAPLVGEEEIKKVIEACKDESGAGKCETSYKLHQCFKKLDAY